MRVRVKDDCPSNSGGAPYRGKIVEVKDIGDNIWLVVGKEREYIYKEYTEIVNDRIVKFQDLPVNREFAIPNRGGVFVKVNSNDAKCIKRSNNPDCIETGHPSPFGSNFEVLMLEEKEKTGMDKIKQLLKTITESNKRRTGDTLHYSVTMFADSSGHLNKGGHEVQGTAFSSEEGCIKVLNSLIEKDNVVNVKLDANHIAVVSKSGARIGNITFPLSVIDEMVAAKAKVS